MPITAIHSNPNNIREGYSEEKLEYIAHQIKRYGVLTSLLVYPHPDIQGDFMIRDGNHRYLAALKIELGELPCEVVPTSDRDDIADLDAMMSTGTSHTPLTDSERNIGVQRYFDLGQNITTIGKKLKMSRSEVQTRAALAKAPAVAKVVQDRSIDLVVAADLLAAEQEIGDPEILNNVLAEVRRYGADSQHEVTRIVEREKSNALYRKLRDELSEAGASEISYAQRYNGKWDSTDADLSVEEHVSAGHIFDIAAGEVRWFAKSKTAKAQLSEAEKHHRERMKHIANELPNIQKARAKFVMDKIRDKKSLEDRNARGLMISMILEGSFGVSNEAGTDALADLSGVPYPENRTWEGSEFVEWRRQVAKALQSFTVGQLAIMLAYLPVAESDQRLEKTNFYMRDSYDKENRWEPISTWYQQLIDHLGYVPADEEIEIIRMSEATRLHPRNDVQLQTATCTNCNQEVVADSHWSGLCDECAPAVDSEVD